MTRRMTKALCFDQMAGNGLWDGFSSEERPKLKRLLNRLALAPEMKILEPGCGTGRLTAALLERLGPKGRIVANDISPRMIAEARRRRLGQRVHWRVAPVEEVRVRRGSVDRVICFQSFPHFDHEPAALRLFRRALKPDGLLAIVHFAGRRKINQIHRRGPEPIRRDLIPTKREMRTLLDAAGFLVTDFVDSAAGYWLFAAPV